MSERLDSPNRRAWQRFRQNKLAVASAWFLLVVVVLVVIWPFVAPHRPDALSDEQFRPPSLRHWFGTDVHGRDVCSRVMYGAQISLLVGIVGAGVSLVIGVSWGATAGYLGGRVDNALMRVVDILYSLPSIIFVIVLITTLEGAFKNRLEHTGSATLASSARLLFLFVGLGAVSWLTMARIVRGQVLSLRSQPFVEASRALGAGPIRILRRHIIPNIIGVVIVYLTLTVPAIVLYESFLSYLGLGIQPPMASWGSLMAEGAEQINPIRIPRRWFARCLGCAWWELIVHNPVGQRIDKSRRTAQSHAQSYVYFSEFQSFMADRFRNGSLLPLCPLWFCHE